MSMVSLLVLVAVLPLEDLFVPRGGFSGFSYRSGKEYVLSEREYYATIGLVGGQVVDWEVHSGLGQVIGGDGDFVAGFEAVDGKLYVARLTVGENNVIEKYDLASSSLELQLNADQLVGKRLQDVETVLGKYDARFRVSHQGNKCASSFMEYGEGWRTFEFELEPLQKFVRELPGEICGYLGEEVVTLERYLNRGVHFSHLRVGEREVDFDSSKEYRVACGLNSCIIQSEGGDYFRLSLKDGKAVVTILPVKSGKISRFHPGSAWLGSYATNTLSEYSPD